MQLTLYKVGQEFVLVSDEKAKEIGTLVLDTDYGKPMVYKTDEGFFEVGKDAFKVIAQPEEIDFTTLSEANQRKIGWFDVYKLANEQYDLDTNRIPLPTSLWFDSQNAQFNSFIKGFRKAQELMDEMFTKEQFEEFMSFHTDAAPISYLKSEFKKTIFSKSWRVEIEMESVNLAAKGNASNSSVLSKGNASNSSVLSNCNNWVSIPKFTDGKIKILDIL